MTACIRKASSAAHEDPVNPNSHPRLHLILKGLKTLSWEVFLGSLQKNTITKRTICLEKKNFSNIPAQFPSCVLK